MRQVWRMLLRNPGGMIGTAILTIAIAVALFGPLLFPTSPWRNLPKCLGPAATEAFAPEANRLTVYAVLSGDRDLR